MTEYLKHLKRVAKQILLLENLRDRRLWDEICEHSCGLSWTALCIFVRVVVLLLAPVSVPLLALAGMHSERKVRSLKKKLKTSGT